MSLHIEVAEHVPGIGFISFFRLACSFCDAAVTGEEGALHAASDIGWTHLGGLDCCPDCTAGFYAMAES